MKYLSFLLIFVGLNTWAEEGPKKLIDINDYNPQAPITEPIGIVDKFGNVEWKYPPKAEENPQSIEAKKEKEKPLPAEDKREKFYKAKDSGGAVEVNGSLLGYFSGVGVLGSYQSGKWSYGGSFRYYMYNSVEDYNFDNLMVTAFMQYHFLPRWYTNSPSHKRFDTGISLNLGYDMVKSDVQSDYLKSTPIIGVGMFTSYPLLENVRVTGRAEIFQGLNGQFSPIGSSLSLGLSYGF